MKFIKKTKTELSIVALFLVLMAVILRFLPHLPNFTPVAAIALFGGVYFSRKIALILPITAMFISDIFIGFYEPLIMLSVYGSFVLCVLLGFWLKKHKNWFTVLGSAFTCSLMFFVITNFAVWAFSPWYAKTLSGLVQCYLMATPFFRNTLLGDLFYASVFFGAYEMVELWVKNRIGVKQECYLIDNKIKGDDYFEKSFS